MANFRSFSIVRDPCERFVSAFTYIAKRPGNLGDAKWRTKNIGSMSLEEYVAFSKFGEESFRQWAHFKHQHQQLFFNNGTFGVELLLCQERWVESMNKLQQYLKPTALPASIFTSRVVRGEHASCSQLPQATHARIREHYAMDYCLFYPPDGKPSACDSVGAGAYTERYQDCQAMQKQPLRVAGKTLLWMLALVRRQLGPTLERLAPHAWHRDVNSARDPVALKAESSELDGPFAWLLHCQHNVLLSDALDGGRLMPCADVEESWEYPLHTGSQYNMGALFHDFSQALTCKSPGLACRRPQRGCLGQFDTSCGRQKT